MDGGSGVGVALGKTAASEGDADALGQGVVVPVAQPARRVIVARPARSRPDHRCPSTPYPLTGRAPWLTAPSSGQSLSVPVIAT
jgi:hypothetical protein